MISSSIDLKNEKKVPNHCTRTHEYDRIDDSELLCMSVDAKLAMQMQCSLSDVRLDLLLNQQNALLTS